MSTTGQQLKKTLGLEGFREVFVSRVLVPSTTKINLVIYDSKRKDLPLSRRKIRNIPYTAMAFSGTYLAQGKYKTPTLLPLINISDFNGILQNYIFLTIDLSFSQLLRKSNFEKLPESLQKKVVRESNSLLLPKGKLSEFVTITDLMDKENIAPSTMEFRKERNGLMGNEAQNAKVVDLALDQADDSITFFFLTESTPKYGDDYQYKETDPETLKLKKNRSKLYEIQIKFLEFFSYLETQPIEEPFTKKDFKELIETLNVQVFSTSPSYQYQSYNYNMSQIDGSVFPTKIAPKVWDKRLGGDFFTDKHLYGVLRNFKFYENIMIQMLNKKLKDRGII